MTQPQAALLVLVAVPVLWFLMWRGWRGRGARQAQELDLPGLPAMPDQPGEHLIKDPVDAVYVSTTTEGDWLDRVVLHGLGVRSAAIVNVSTEGVSVWRQGAPALHIPAASVVAARLDSGMAGKFTGPEGLVVITWTHGGHRLETGLRVVRKRGRAEVLAAVQQLTEVEA